MVHSFSTGKSFSRSRGLLAHGVWGRSFALDYAVVLPSNRWENTKTLKWTVLVD